MGHHPLPVPLRPHLLEVGEDVKDDVAEHVEGDIGPDEVDASLREVA